MFDFHVHTLYSDGAVLPVELLRRAQVSGLRAVAIADHAGPGNLETLLKALLADCKAFKAEGMVALAGVELTHIPPELYGEAVRRGRELGAQLIIGHGETLAEPVCAGTNLAAIEAGVDILGHPGLISEEEARLAAERGTFLELSARKGHCLSNGHVAAVALRCGANLIVGSDAHLPEEVLDRKMAEAVALGAGLPQKLLDEVLVGNPEKLLAKMNL